MNNIRWNDERHNNNERCYINHDSMAIKKYFFIDTFLLVPLSFLVFNSLPCCHKFHSMRNLLRRTKKERKRRQEPQQKKLPHKRGSE